MDKNSFTGLALSGILSGGLAITGCQKTTASEEKTLPAIGIMAAKVLTDFESECTQLSGEFMTHGCNGHNTCKGYSYDGALTPPVYKHDGSGKSSCNGGSCKVPAAT
jgi:hypothetical protein